MDANGTRANGKAAMVVGALGVVFGDIGTSPIYTIQTVFNPDDPHPVQSSIQSVYGIVSLIFWSVTIIVTFKYVLLVMRADNQGEGGIMALVSQVRQVGDRVSGRTKFLLAGLGVFGAALFFGDSMITPAISVLSAVEGVKVIQPSLDSLVVPITATIIVVLFATQKLGTGAVGRMFGPIMIGWFTTIAILGIHGITLHPEVLKALSPTYAVDFLFHGGSTGFFSLAAVVLAITGAEALYADLGHFGRPAITRAWLLLVFPACILSYLGQGGLILDDPSTISAPFFQLMPDGGLIPLVVLSTAATVIASQAVISGAFSIAHQAAQLGYLPRLRIVHTSEREIGQVYVPFVNWTLFAAVLILVFAFERSEKLAAAYGIAVTGTITITLTLFLVYARRNMGLRLWQLVAAGALFGIVDIAFLGANLVKVFKGGWLPIIVGIGIYIVLSTWQQGQRIVTRNREREEGSLAGFIEVLRITQPPVQRVPGTAVFLHRGVKTTPLAMRANVDHNHALHESALIVSIDTLPVPYVPDDERLTVSDLSYRDDGISLIVARYGFEEHADIPAIVREAAGQLENRCDLDEITYFLSKIEIVQTDAPGMAPWRKRLFLATAHIAADAVDYFRLPRERTVLLGSAIEI